MVARAATEGHKGENVARTAPSFKTLFRNPCCGRRELLRTAGRSDRIPGPQRIRQVDHYEDDHGPDQTHQRYDSLRSRDIADDPIAYKRRMGYVPEEPYLYNHLSGYEYLTMVAQLRDLPEHKSREKIEGLLTLLDLYTDRYAGIAGYSKGMRQKILLIAAIMHDPQLVLLDEPFSGLDVGSALVLRSLIQELAARGKVVLFSSHELDTVERICSRVVILHRGKLVANDTIEALRVLASQPTLEGVFSQLAVEQDTGATARLIAETIHG